MYAKLTALSVVALSALFVAQAHAQTAPDGERGFTKPLEAPTRALEVVVGTGWTQGYGQLQRNVYMQDVITPGIAVDLGVMYRFNPHWAVGATGQYQEFEAERATGARGMTAGLAAAYHVAPFARTDPWIQLGTGYRALWETHQDSAPNTVTQGLELAKLTLGIDFRVSRDVAIAPVVGADLTVPLWQNTATESASAISDPRVATFVFAGVQARFDITGKHVSARHVQQNNEQELTQARVQPVRPVSPSINVSQEVIDACKLDIGNIDTAPKFDFDRSELTADDTRILDQLVACFTTGPLKNAKLDLVGRADPRGPVDYNDKLGMRRAESVGSYLSTHGVVDDRIDRETRGKRDATGTDEAGWAIDRRVDVTLAR